ncbi:MAG: T9SS type A sorting domain-containing protein [Paludibacteraceae bacterium]|nr:T9SS type A sorting domain-containing protein [Paludibacteraceae bacterium]
MKRIFTAFMMMLCAVCGASAANYLTFTAAEEGSSFGIKNTNNNPDVQYSLDDGATWNLLADGESIPLAKKGDRALLKGNNPEGFSHDYLNCTQFVMSGSISASGSVMSLIDGKGESLTIPNKKCFYYLFSNCESLVQAPELPATHLADSCYANMFYFCTNLEKAPELPATELAEYCYFATFACCRKMVDVPQLPASVMVKGCYNSMFLGCYSLKQAPELPSTELANSCYANMFAYCIGLEKAPELPATVVVDSCYLCMFSRCDSLTQAPALPATELAYRCYYSMFDYCVSLEVAPELPATTLAEQCYYNMFSECFSLKKAPELPATELVKGCYTFMFNDCTSLTEVKAHFTSWEYVGYTYWLSAVAWPGTFYCPRELAKDTFPSDIPYRWVVKYNEGIDTTANYLTFTAEEDGSSFMIEHHYMERYPNIRYSLDGGESWAALMYGDTVFLPKKGDRAMLSGNNPAGLSQSYTSYSSFIMNGKIAASGSVMSLIDVDGLSTEIPNGHCFCRLFEGCKALSKAPELPATTLKESCYMAMFKDCEYMLQAPELPATTMADSCYAYMFSGCEDMKSIPALPATELAVGCYSHMFMGCTSLPRAPELPAMTMAEGCYSWMFAGSYLRMPPALPAMTLAKGCYEGMFAGAPLSQAPELPATTMAENCYKYMFSSCDLLYQAPELPAMNLAEGCYSHMFSSCAYLEWIPTLPATTLADSCYANMFDECSVLARVPEISATKMAKGSCFSMFWGCGYIRSVTLPAAELAEGCYTSMFDGCEGLSKVSVSFDQWETKADGKPFSNSYLLDVNSTGTFICPKGLPLEYGASRIPEGWTVKYSDDTTVAGVNYLSFTSDVDGSSFQLVNNNGNTPHVEYSMDGGYTWSALAPGEPVLMDRGDEAMLRGNNPNGFSQSWSSYSNFSMTGKIAASGSVMSLVDGKGMSTVIPNGHCFCRLFEGCKALRRFPELPATTLKESCYKAMFKGCEYADYAPVLPATTMADSCYASMFEGCEDMNVAPALPATELAVGCYSSMFEICYVLAQTPKLPATELAEGCYSRMFLGCEGLMQAPALPAMTLEKGCYERMFAGTGLARVPELPATTLAERCYNQMFRSCGNLRQASALPAMNLAKSCYDHMFSGCVNLEQAPALPATTLADSCYAYMFDECITFTQIPELPATKLAKGCYSFMFWECFYVRSATLPATELAEGCYSNMFDGCSDLIEVRVSFDQWQTADGNPFSDSYLRDVASTGTFICPKGLPLEYGTSRIPSGWTVKYIEEEPNYLTFTAEEDNVSVAVTEGEAGGGDIQPAPYPQASSETAASVSGAERFSGRRNLPAMSTDLKYSTDGGETWTEMVPGTPVTLPKKGDKILFKGNNPSGFSTETQRIKFDIEGAFSASGNVMSLIDESGWTETIPNEYCFANLFESCSGLTKMPDLGATELKAYCYKDMFRGCTSLTSTSALPAYELKEGSYEGMFYDCKNLSEVKVSFSDWEDGTVDWLHGVAPEGKVISPANLARNVGDNYIPDGWILVSEDTITSISNALANNITIWTDNLAIYVRGAKGEVSIYDLSGKRVAVSYSADEERALSVPAKGVYVVRTNNGTSDVLVR